METIYKPKRLRRAGMVLAALFTMMLLLPTYAAFAQGNQDLYLTIECYGLVKVKVAGNTQAVAVIQGPEDLSLIEPPNGFPASGVYYLKVIPFPGYEFAGWEGDDGGDVFDILPSPPVPLPPDDQGYQYGLTMNTQKDITAVFKMVDLDPPMTMSDDFSIAAIPGTDPLAIGTPLIVHLDATYPTITTGTYPGVLVDALLQTTRTNGFTGLRILDITPNPGGLSFPIVLDGIEGIFGVDANDLLLSAIFDYANGITIYSTPTLESQSGIDLDWVITFDGFLVEETFDVTISTVAYQDPDIDLGFIDPPFSIEDPGLCWTVLADTEIDVTVEDVQQAIGAGLTVPASGPRDLSLQLIKCCTGTDGFQFWTTMEYPAIENVDYPEGLINVDVKISSGRGWPVGTVIDWTYEDSNGSSTGGTYTEPSGTDEVYLSTITGYLGELIDHDGLTVEWTFHIKMLEPCITDLEIQPLVTIDGSYDPEYNFGQKLELELINLALPATLEITTPGDISTATYTPVIIPVTTDFGALDATCDGIMIDGRISGYPSPVARVMEPLCIILGVRANGDDVALVDPEGVLLTGGSMLFSEIFAEEIPRDLIFMGFPYNAPDLDGRTIDWEFDILYNGDPTTFTLTFELFSYYYDNPSIECILDSDAVDLTYDDAVFYTLPTPTRDVDAYAEGCLNSPIEFQAIIEYPAIANIEPTPMEDITADAIISVDREVPDGTLLEWDYNGGFNSTYEFDGSEPDPLYLSYIILNSDPAGIANTPFVGHNLLTDTWTFDITIPNEDNDDALTNAGHYLITIQPVVQLEPYADFIYVESQVVDIFIPTYWLTMAKDPDYVAGNHTIPSELAGPYEFGCGAIVNIQATATVNGGWTFSHWGSVTECRAFPDDYDSFENTTLSTTKYRMPECNSTVTAYFDQDEYEFIIGVTGCDQMVKVWDEAMSTVIAVLSGNRDCADIEPASGDELTFTHGETIWLEVIADEGWTWGEWQFCPGGLYTGDPLAMDADFSYEGETEDGFLYKLIFRSDKELMAIFRYNLYATIIVDDKIYDSDDIATDYIDQEASYLSEGVECEGYDCKVAIDWTGVEATFENEHVGTWDIDVTGLALDLADDCYYILGPTSFDPETGYGVPNTEGESEASITPFEVCVSDLEVDPWSKVYDGTTDATVYGTVGPFILGDDVVGTVDPEGWYASKDVGLGIEVFYDVYLTGTDAENYVLCDPLPSVYADITCRYLIREGIVADTREYDGTTDATIDDWGYWAPFDAEYETGIVPGECVKLVTTGYVAYFDTEWVGVDKDVTIDYLGLGGTGCPMVHTNDWENYCLTEPVMGTGTIVVPPYAMFDPSYDWTCDEECDEILNFPVEDPLVIEFSTDIFTNQGLQLPTTGTGMGNFVRLEMWDGDGDPDCWSDTYPDPDWIYVPFFSSRVGNIITVVPGTPGPNIPVNLEWDTYYRLRFGDIWAENTVTGELEEVIYRLDQDGLGEFDPTIDCAFDESQQIIFRTIPELFSPVVEPLGCEEGEEFPYNADIKITFVNPVKYTNGNMISGEEGEPTHKFQLQAKPKGTSTWYDVLFEATATDFGWVGELQGATEITLTPLDNWDDYNPSFLKHPAGEMLHCHDYQVIWRDGMADDGAGFIDMTDLGRVGANEDFPDEGSYVEWWWCTTCEFPIMFSYTQNDARVFPPDCEILNNLKFKQSSTTLVDLNEDGDNYTSNLPPVGTVAKGLIDGYTVIMPTIYNFERTIGEGYHIENWKGRMGSTWSKVWYRSSPQAWKYQNADPDLTDGVPGNQWNEYVDQTNAIFWTADPAVPYEEYQWNVHYGINHYTIYASKSPSWRGNVAPPSSYVAHGETATFTATPHNGSYNVGWSYPSFPNGVVVTQTFYGYDPCDGEAGKPEFVDPQQGEITVEMKGPNLTNNYSNTVTAIFDEFFPRIDLEVRGWDPLAEMEVETPGCNYVTYTAKFVQGEDWGILCAEQNWAVFYYETPITLTPVPCPCGWEFSHFALWNGEYNGEDRVYVTGPAVDSYLLTAELPIIKNLDIIAYFKRSAYHITAVTNPSEKGSVLLEGVNAVGTSVALIDAAAATGDDFIFGTVLDLTVYPEPGYEVKSWNNPLVVPNGTPYIDRSYWTYTVGGTNPNSGTCGQPYDLVANIGLREYVIQGLPFYNDYQNITGGKVVGAPSGSYGTLNKFYNNSSAGTAIGTFQHFQHPTPFTLTANANTYYRFDHWYDVAFGNIGSANPLNLSMVNGPREIHAIFVVDLPTYPVTVIHDPAEAGDYEIVKQNGTTKSVYMFYKHNQLPGFPSVISVEAVPEIGWEFVDWTVTGFTPGAGQLDDNPIVFNMPANAVTLEANYQKIDYELDLVCRTYLRPASPCNCNIVNYGLILEDVTPGSDGIYNFGDVITLKATPIPGFTFVNWMVGTLSDWPGCGERTSEDCILTGWQIDPIHAPRPYPQPMTFTYTIPPQWDDMVTLYALAVETAFPQYPIYSLTTSDDPDGKGVTWGDGNYPETVVAMVDQYETTPGWGFVEWDVYDPNVAPPYDYLFSDSDSPLGIYMDGDKEAVAEYDLIEYELTLYAIGCGSVWAQDQDHNYMYNIEDDPIPIFAYEDCCNYDFVGWFYDYLCTIPVTDATGTPITAPNFGWIPQPYDVTIYGKFVETFFDVGITLVRDECDSGLVPMGCTAEVISGPGPYALDEVVTLQATPGPGYVFDYWANPMCEVLVEDEVFNHTILCQWNDFVAVFDAIPYNVTLTADPVAGGTVAGDGVYYIGDNVTVTAAPTVGWVFNGWYQGATLKSTNLSYTFVMPADNVALTAEFEITQVTLTVTIDGGTGCTVTVKNGTTVLTPPYTVDYGTVLTLDPAPDGLFLNWTGDLTGTANPATLTMNGNKAVVAHFGSCDPVTNLASTTTAKSAEVSWTTPAGQTAELRYKLSIGSWNAWAAATSPKLITGLTPDKLYNVEVRTVCGTGIYSETVAGTFTTKMLGDVNCDGVVNVLDVIVLTNYIMGIQDWTQCIGDGGDINGDGDINVLDVVSLINIILGNTSKASVMSMPADIYLTPGLIMFSSDGTLAGLQFELNGPQVRDVELTLNLEGFQLLYSVEGNTLSGMIYNLDNEPIPSGMINLITMNGEGIIEWGNVMGANYGESEVQVNKHGAISDAFTLMVYPNPSKGEINALFSVPLDSKVNIRLLDFSGRVISELTDAVYTYGEHLINWTNSQTLTTGLYILQMNAITEDASHQVFRQEVKVVIIK